MNVLAIDIGGTNVKLLATGQDTPRRFPSGPKMAPMQMVAGVKKLAGRWKYDAVSLGYPGPVLKRPVARAHNLGSGWVGFDFEAAFGRPSRLSTTRPCRPWGATRAASCCSWAWEPASARPLVVDGIVEPMELAHLPYRSATFEDYVGLRGLEKLGKKKWRRACRGRRGARLIAALQPDDVVLGGGNVKKLKELPAGCRGRRQRQRVPRRVSAVGASR